MSFSNRILRHSAIHSALSPDQVSYVPVDKKTSTVKLLHFQMMVI